MKNGVRIWELRLSADMSRKVAEQVSFIETRQRFLNEAARLEAEAEALERDDQQQPGDHD